MVSLLGTIFQTRLECQRIPEKPFGPKEFMWSQYGIVAQSHGGTVGVKTLFSVLLTFFRVLLTLTLFLTIFFFSFTRILYVPRVG
jgi:hypothetical protein